MDSSVWEVGGFALWWVVPFLLLYAIASYYDTFRAKLVPNILATLALVSIVAGKSIENGWDTATLVLAGIVLFVCVGLAFFGNQFGWGDAKWMPLTALALGPVAYFAILLGMLFGLCLAIPLALYRVKKGLAWRKTPIPLVPPLFAGTVAVLIQQGYFESMLSLLIIGLGILALMAYGMWEKKHQPLPTWDWLHAQDPQAKDWEIFKGWASSGSSSFKWSKDRHRILLHDLLTEEAQMAVWEGRKWQGPSAVKGWEMELKPTPRLWGVYRPPHSPHLLLHAVSADESPHASK